MSRREVSFHEPEGPERFESVDVSEFDEFRIAVYTAKDLCKLPLPQDDPELVGPFLRRGRITLLGATTGHGKTTFGVQMLAAAVLGGDFLGWQVGGGLRVLVLDLEQHLEDIQEQLAAVGLAGSELVDYAPIPEGLQIDRDAAHLAELERIVAAKPYDIVRLDPFYKLHAADSSEETQARELVRLTRRWVTLHGFALLMDTHTRKRIEGRAGFTLDDLFGSSLFARDPETILGLQMIEEGFSRLQIFKARGRRGQIRTGQTIDLLYSDEELFRRKPDEAERDLRAELLELAADHVWRTLKEWRAKPGEEDVDPAAANYVELRGGVGAGQEKVRAELLALQREEVFEYAGGLDAGRSGGAKCWRLRTDPGAQVTPGQWGQLEALRGSDDATDPLTPPPKGSAGSGVSGPSNESGLTWALRSPAERDRPPPGFWRDARTGKEWRAERELREATRLLAIEEGQDPAEEAGEREAAASRLCGECTSPKLCAEASWCQRIPRVGVRPMGARP